MKLLPFDLEKALNGHPVCTRDGRKVEKIFDTGVTDLHSIIAVCEDKWHSYTKLGLFFKNSEDYRDLFLYQEPKKYWVVVWEHNRELCSIVKETEKEAKGIAYLLNAIKVLEFEL